MAHKEAWCEVQREFLHFPTSISRGASLWLPPQEGMPTVVLHVVMGAFVAWASSGVASTKAVAVRVAKPGQARAASVFIAVSGVNTRLCVRCHSSSYPTATYASTSPNKRIIQPSTAVAEAATVETQQTGGSSVWDTR